MTVPPIRSRRRLLSSLGLVAIGSLAGCSDTSAGSESADDSTTGASDAESADDDSTDDAADDLDLQEANVVGVEVSEGDGSYDFAVTLHHDDDGEDGYANRWQVEQPDGTELGRRELRHAHSQQPFTRSETVEIPNEVECVVVRGHDQTHEYGGQAMIVTPATGATQAVDQGAEPDSLKDIDCP